MKRPLLMLGSSIALAVGAFTLSCSDSSNSNIPIAGLPLGQATLAQVTRGRYLVTAVGACSECHNRGTDNPNDPNWLAGYIQSATINPGDQGKFQVGPFTTFAANLTPDPATGLGNWSSQDIFNALRLGHDPQGMFLCPPMPWPVFRNMADDDLWSIVAYLQHIKPVTNAVPPATGPGVPAGQHADCSIFYQNLPPIGLPPFPAGNETTTAAARSVNHR